MDQVDNKEDDSACRLHEAEQEKAVLGITGKVLYGSWNNQIYNVIQSNLILANPILDPIKSVYLPW